MIGTEITSAPVGLRTRDASSSTWQAHSRKGARILRTPSAHRRYAAPRDSIIQYTLLHEALEACTVRLASHRDAYTPGEVFKAMMMGIPVTRPENPRTTHKGFDFRELRLTVSDRFVVDAVHLSPVPHMPWWVSSQYFMIRIPNQMV